MNMKRDSKKNEIEKQKLNDFELIKKIERKECSIMDFDNDTKVRLINLIAERSEKLEEKIERAKKKKTKNRIEN